MSSAGIEFFAKVCLYETLRVAFEKGKKSLLLMGVYEMNSTPLSEMLDGFVLDFNTGVYSTFTKVRKTMLTKAEAMERVKSSRQSLEQCMRSMEFGWIEYLQAADVDNRL
jgi:hypothetical protein